MLNTFKLKNGIKIATYRMPTLRSVDLRVIVKAGSILETKKINGRAHFMEHMLVQGTPSLPTVQKFAEYIEGFAGRYGAGTGQTTTDFSITLPSPHLENAVKIASEVIFMPLFPEDAQERERQAITEEVLQNMSTSGYKTNKFIRENIFKKESPFALQGGGMPNVLAKLTRENLTFFWEKYFVPNNTYILILGNFQEEKLKRLLKKYFEQYPKKEDYSKLPDFSKNEFSNIKTAIRHDKTMKSNYIDLVFPSLTQNDKLILKVRENIAFYMLSRLRNSRLFKLLRNKLGLVYGVSGSSYYVSGLGYSYISSEVSQENLEKVLTIIVEELKRFIIDGPEDTELNFAKEYLANQWLMDFDHPASIANWIEGELLWEDKIRLPEEYIDLIKDTTPNDILGLMQKYWEVDKAKLIIQGPVVNSNENKERFRNILKRIN